MLIEAGECYTGMHAEKDEQRTYPTNKIVFPNPPCSQDGETKVYLSAEAKKSVEPWAILKHSTTNTADVTGSVAVSE